MEQKLVLKNRIIAKNDIAATMDALKLRYNITGQSIYDINLVIYELTNDECVIASSFINDILVGSAYIKTLTLNNGEEVLLLDNMFVIPEFRNKGVGTHLLYYVLSSKSKLNKRLNKECQRILVKPFYSENKDWYTKVGFEDVDGTFMCRKM